MKRIALMMWAVLVLCGTTQAAIWIVPGDFTTIQEAIDSADVSDGDSIRVGPGKHPGAVVTKSLEIKGEGRAIINSGPLLTTYKPCDTIVLGIGFFFDGSGAGGGATISNLDFEALAFPVFSRGADDVTITQCTMKDPVQGVTNWGGSRWEISHNEIIDLRSASGGGIGILVGDSSGGFLVDNVISHNKISGTLHVAQCDSGGYAGTGIVLYADWRYRRDGSSGIMYNRIVKNKIGLTSDNPTVVDVWAIELSEAENPGDMVILDNAIGFNDLRGTVLQIALSPESLEEVNNISRNLGDNRGHGLHPSVFGPGGN